MGIKSEDGKFRLLEMHSALKGCISRKSYYWRVELGLSIFKVLSSIAQLGSFHCMVLGIPKWRCVSCGPLAGV